MRARRSPPLVRQQPPPASTTNSLDFSIKTLDQIREEKRKKQQLQRGKADEDEEDRREGDVAGIVRIDSLSGEEQANRTTTLLVSQSVDKDKALKKEREGGKEEREEREEEREGDFGKELPKMVRVAPQKRKRVVIKRSTLRKNADSAPLSSAESAITPDQATSDLAPSPKRKYTTEETSTTDSQTRFDATCIDRSVPLPDNQQEQRESKQTLLLLLILEQLPLILPLYV